MITADDIEIEIETKYLSKESQAHPGRHFFRYIITIHNRGNESVQLISRYWKFIGDDTQIKEVHGQGVVGQQPIIPPSGSYTYASGADMGCGGGTMEGSYQMIDSKGRFFDVPVLRMALTQPNKLH